MTTFGGGKGFRAALVRVLLCGGLLALLCKADAAGAPAGLKRILSFSKRRPGSTEPYAAADTMMAALARAQGFQIRFSTDSNLIQYDSLRQYQVVIWNNVMRNVLSPAQQDAFQRYMENGGGYMGFHAAATNRRIWPWYVDQFLGGDNHSTDYIAWGKTTLYADTVARPGHAIGAEHSIMAGVPHVIPQYGEWYRWDPNPADNPTITVLLWYQPKSINASWPQALPAVWCREYGSGPVKGRLFYIQVSHMDSIYASAWYRTMAGNALKWVTHGDEPTGLAGPDRRDVADSRSIGHTELPEGARRLDGRRIRGAGQGNTKVTAGAFVPVPATAPHSQ